MSQAPQSVTQYASPEWPKVPDGYRVFLGSDEKYAWELISDPKSHHCSGFSTRAEALTHCREDQLPHDTYK